MAEQEVVSGLRKRWSALRSDIVFLPRLDQMHVATQDCGLEVVEFVRVAPSDEEIMVPQAAHVTSADVREYDAWSDAEADQQRMWALVGTAIEGNKITRTCPDCHGSREVTCDDCNGHGRVNCSWCHGSGNQSCSSCGGSGHRSVSRTQTNSDGTTSTVWEQENCLWCHGSGRQRCNHCQGSGQVTCSRCSGSGEVECETCCPAGTVDIFTRRSFVERTAATHILPVRLPDYPEPIRLPATYVELHPREQSMPLDSVADRAQLEQRSLGKPDSRIFFVRQATVTLHAVRDPQTGYPAVSYIEGEPEPILTLHRATPDWNWTPDRERRKALGASILYALAPIALGGLGTAGLAGYGLAAAVVMVGAALWLYRHPLRAFRLAFFDVRCPRHERTVTMRCPACEKDLCHECLMPLARCPHCGTVASQAITHLVEDGKWVETHPTDAPTSEGARAS